MKNRILAITAAILAMYALIGFILIPKVIESQIPSQSAKFLNAQVSVSNVTFNPFTFKLALEQMKLTQKDETYMTFNRFEIDFSMLRSIFETHIHFKQVLLSDSTINIELLKNGELNFSKLIKKTTANTTATKEPKENKESSSFTIPFKIGKSVLDNVNLNIKVATKDEPLDIKLHNLNYTFYDLGTYKNALSSHKLVTKINEETTLKIDGGLKINPFRMYGNIVVDDLKINDFLPYASDRLNFTTSDAFVDINFGYHTTIKDGFIFELTNANITVENLNLIQDDTEFLGFDSFKVSDVNLYYPEYKLNIGAIAFDKLYAKSIMKNNKLNFSNIVKNQDNEQIEELRQDLREKRRIGKDIWDIKIKDIALNNANFSFMQPKQQIKANDIDIKISQTNLIDTQLSVADILIQNKTLQIQDTKQNIQSKNIALNIKNLQRNLKQTSIEQVAINNPYTKLSSKENTIIAKNLDFDLFKFFNEADLIKVDKSTLKRPKIAITLKKKRTTKEVEKKTKTTAQQTKSALNLDFGPFNIIDANIIFEDKNLPIPFKSNISKLNGNFSELITKSSKPTKLKLEGQVDKYGYTKITGLVDHKNIKNLTDVQLLFKNIAIKNFTPYSGKFVGREIDEGKLNLNLKYNITKSDIDAKNSIVISDIKLGKKVDNKDALSLPLDLAIALMEDTNGVIDLNIPISGNVDDPKFSIAPIVWQAFTNLIVKAVTSPFRFLASLFDFNEDEIKDIDFEYGSSTLIASEKETLDKIAQIFAKRPNIALKIKPTYNTTQDTKALQLSKFETFINAQMDAIKEGKDKYLIALESNYIKYKEIKPIKSLKEELRTKEDKLDKVAYIDYLEAFLTQKQTVSPQELEQLAKNRAQSLLAYLNSQHKISNNRVLINKNVINDESTKDWVKFNLEIGLKE